MKAIIIEQAGGVENLRMTDLPEPTIGENEVLVETRALGINPADFKVRSASEALAQVSGGERPIILGWDIAGAVVATGSKVSKFEVGDKVFGMVNFPNHGKAYAQFVASPESHLAMIPEGVSFNDAAATTLAALTALQALNGRVKPGNKVLIHAGSGGVGHFAIQIAKQMGAHVVSTSSEKNRAFVLALGADEHIDYRNQAFEVVLSDIDLAFDTVSPDIAEKSLKVLRKGGELVSLTIMGADEELQTQAGNLGVTVTPLLVQSSGDDMDILSNMLAEGSVKPYVSQTFDFAHLADAHTALEGGRTIGKVVVTL